jgi:DNA-directed RNA polymerase subunit L
MKKWLFLFAGILAAALAGIYIFIPKTLQITSISTINCPQRGVELFLTNNEADWRKWWPDTTKPGLQYNGHIYHIIQQYPNSVQLTVETADSTFRSMILLAIQNKDTVNLGWQTSIETSLNPIAKIAAYRKAVAIKKDFSALLNTLKKYTENLENVYGFRISKVVVTDTL